MLETLTTVRDRFFSPGKLDSKSGSDKKSNKDNDDDDDGPTATAIVTFLFGKPHQPAMA